MAEKKVVIATNNAHKLEEISRMLAPATGWEFVSLKECGSFPEPIEDADNFEGNARIKARAARDNTGLPALADDSGLVVDALDGAPGVYSSRFAGQDANDADNNEKLLSLLSNVPDKDRTARFVCTLVFVDMDDSEIIAQGTCEGKIGYERRGENGFGYDPLFISDAHDGLTMAQVSAGEKDAVSHRGEALRAFIKEFESQK
jgi:XTP/dITP diphosphohydrolase